MGGFANGKHKGEKNMWKLPNGKTINNPKDVEIDGVKYPSSIFRKWKKEELNAIGIFPFREVKYDQIWFRTTGSTDIMEDGEVVREHTITEKHTNNSAKEIQVDKVKVSYISNINKADDEANFYDAVGDSITKKLWTDWGLALKKDAKDLKDAVNNAGTHDQIINLDFQWTEAPDGTI